MSSNRYKRGDGKSFISYRSGRTGEWWASRDKLSEIREREAAKQRRRTAGKPKNPRVILTLEEKRHRAREYNRKRARRIKAAKIRARRSYR